MSELDLLNLARSATEHQVTWFAQMITINFAMVVAFYYFLSGAKIVLKIFSFFAYTVGMLVLLGEMLVETNVKAGVIEALRMLLAERLSRPVVYYIAVWMSCLNRNIFHRFHRFSQILGRTKDQAAMEGSIRSLVSLTLAGLLSRPGL